MAYVGMTRAKRRLGITYSAERYRGYIEAPLRSCSKSPARGKHRCDLDGTAVGWG